MIGLLAVRELDGDFPPGSVVQELFIHSALLADEPILTAVKRQAVAQVAEHSTAVDPAQVCTYVFAPAYLDGVVARWRNGFDLALADDRLGPNLGTVCAVWWAR